MITGNLNTIISTVRYQYQTLIVDAHTAWILELTRLKAFSAKFEQKMAILIEYLSREKLISIDDIE
jgi:hypothetical protein